jgi:hypothetical protein
VGVSIKLVRVVVVVGRGFYEGFPALRQLKQREQQPINKPIPLVGTEADIFSRGSRGQKVSRLEWPKVTLTPTRLASTSIRFYADDGHQRRPLKQSFPICVLTGCRIWHFSGGLLGHKIVKGDPKFR